MISLLKSQTSKKYFYEHVSSRFNERDFQIYFIPQRGIVIKVLRDWKYNKKVSSLELKKSIKIGT